jgi:hypothetical protein
MKPEGSQKVRAALEQLRQQRAAAAENRTEPTPRSSKEHRPGYQR